MSYVQDGSLLSLARECVELSALGMEPGEGSPLDAEIASLTLPQKDRVNWFVAGSAYERRAFKAGKRYPRPAVTPPEPGEPKSYSGPWRHANDFRDNALRVASTTAVTIFVVAALFISYVFGRVSQAAADDSPLIRMEAPHGR